MDVAVGEGYGDADASGVGKSLGTSSTFFLMKMIHNEYETVEGLLSGCSDSDMIRGTDNIWCAGS